MGYVPATSATCLLPEGSRILVRQVLAEARVRLVAGLKRYFHDKRRQGLLSAKGILVLDHACDVAMDASASPLDVWSSLERCTSAPGHTRSIPSTVKCITCVHAECTCRRSDASFFC